MADPPIPSQIRVWSPIARGQKSKEKLSTFSQSLRADVSAAAVPIEPGTQQLSVDVTVVFAIG